MKKPEPQIGQIVKFDYLWRDEAVRGRLEGTKERPCAVVVARRQGEDGSHIVLLAPITHSPPRTKLDVIEIPAQAQVATGLDEGRSWLVLSEVNIVPWSDAGIIPARQGQWLFGHLPRGVAQRAAEIIIDRLRLRKLEMVSRTVEG